MLYAGDERRHNNPNLAYADADFIRGGGRSTANLTTLLTDFTGKTDQLKENVTTVYVVSEDKVYRLKSIAQIGSLTNGWSLVTVDLSGKVDKVAGKGLSTLDYTIADKSKLDAIVEHFKGKYTALNNAPASGSEGDYIFIDAGAGSDAREYIWDSTDNSWKPSSNTGASSFAQLSGNPNENAALNAALGGKVDREVGKGLSSNDYTDAEKNRLTNTSGNNTGDQDISGIAANTVAISNLVSGLNNEITARQSADALKVDKLINFYSTQTASFNLSIDMVNTIVPCYNNSATITAILNIDGLFPVGARLTIKKIGNANVILTASANITLLAPQGTTLYKQNSCLEVVKQGPNTYSVIIFGDDPTKPNKSFCLSFLSPANLLPDYFDTSSQITSIQLISGVTNIKYSVNGGSTYTTPILPLSSPINFDGGTMVIWQITYSMGSVRGLVHIKYV